MWWKDFFDKKYIDYLKKETNNKSLFFELKFLRSYFNKSDKILDLACGYGRHLIPLSRQGYNIVGLDYSKDMLDDLKRNYRKAEIIKADMRYYAKGEFNVIYSFFSSFGYFSKKKEDEKVIKNVSKMLLPGGNFIIDLRNSLVDSAVKMKKRINEKEIREYQMRRYGSKSLKKILLKYDLKPQEIFGNYKKEKYNPRKSRRMIVVAEKIN